ncbi:3-ketoacyl-CoA thiolase 2 [Populus alba x Populus x berolinensis]|nr:3-ketoacyl-CoA thiolase 2 [Populus alba x Populus x berolinensis]
MDLIISCHSFTSFHRQITSTNSSSLKCRCAKTTSELQTSVGVNDRTGNSPSIPPHKVTVHYRQRGVVHEFLVPENHYILHKAESQNITLPFACRHGCCTSCAVLVKLGQLRQPEALWISVELKSKSQPRKTYKKPVPFVYSPEEIFTHQLHLRFTQKKKGKMEKAINRQRVLLDHLRPSSPSPHNFESTLSASTCLAGDSAAYQRTSAFGDDVVIVAAYRTPLCKSKRGGFKDTHANDLLAPVLKALIEKTNVDPREVGDIVVGSVLAPGSQRASECRMAAFYAGFPETVPIRTVNRQCSSGLQAVADVAASIKAGFYEIGIGAGLESMTINPMAWDGDVNPKVKDFQKAQDCLLPMGVTSENVAHCFGVTRQEQDQVAVDSHRKAAAATASGRFKDEIIPVPTKIVDPKTGGVLPIVISVDDGIRPNTSLTELGKLKPLFKKDGTTTAGNSSQVSDGAGAVLLMKRSVAMRKGLPILGVFRTFTAVGVDPAIMGVGPAVAIPAAVKAAGLELEDIDLFEINEAFASQFVYCRKKLELDSQKINVNGGAMAMGHPLGATGARCVATLLHEMKRSGRDCRFGVVSMCIGTGMGAAAVFERGDGCDELCNGRKVESNNLLSKDSR